MSERVWTENQKKAINARGMQVLVSAAAGSGKTAVLTERVKNVLCDTDNPCAVSEILVVTFTRAAATEMRDRIYKALSDEMSKNGGNNDYLYRQMIMLPTADICTIDSFCAKIVRENFHLANVGADFKILDEKDSAELMADSAEEVINELYENSDNGFHILTKLFLNERDDASLKDVIISLYKYSRAYPVPFKWLDEVAEKFSPDKTPDETGLTEIVYKYMSVFADFYLNAFEKCIDMMNEDGNFGADYYMRFERTGENLKKIKIACDVKNWNYLVSVLRGGIIEKQRLKASKADEYTKNFVKEVFGELESDLKTLLKRTLPTIEEHKIDCEKLYPAVQKLCFAVKRLTAVLDEKKDERKSYTFDDILHKCIDLLVCYNQDGTEEKTQLAKELCAKYKEILIDEYQDTNRAQNTVFEVISRNKTNLYAVGDVKQSIYRFRLASPDLFTELKSELAPYDEKVHPSKIILEKNFRSREGITHAVNAVFEKVMSDEVGEIDYNTEEYLYFGADKFPEKGTADAEILFIDKDAENGDLTEPETVASYIKSVVASGAVVGLKDNTRKVQWGDFCILLRSMTKASDFADELKKNGIPVSLSVSGESCDYNEIRFLISLIKVVNNPLVDIPLVAVMMSPVFGFTPDELAEIRTISRKSDIYACLVKYSETSAKARSFLDKISLYRNIAAAYPVNDFVKFLVTDTAVADIYFASGEGEQRKANVKGFVKSAEDFANSRRTGLNDFVRYIDNACANGGLVAFQSSSDDTNSVKIMSVHKSKGLEFPYVILANCSKRINKRDSFASLTVARETGIGLKIRDDELFTQYHTLSSVATEKAILFGDQSEELRVLYVAMTRAKEHIVFVCDTSSKSLKRRVRLNSLLSGNKTGKLHPYAVYRASTVSDWILSAFSQHRDCGIIRDLCSLPSYRCEDTSNFGIDTRLNFADLPSLQQGKTPDENAPVDDELLKTLKQNISYSYKYDFSGILAKRTASSTENHIRKKEYFADKKPDFLSDKLTAAQRGTAIHKFLEICDFKAAANNCRGEADRLLKNGYLTETEAEILDFSAVDAFFESDIGKRLLASKQILKEYEFSVLKNAEELYDNLPDEARKEEIVVQGKFDCAFTENGKAVLIDYKTDNITDESLFVKKYSEQLKIYADALFECIGTEVKEKYIYSFKLKKFIEI